MSKVLSMKLDGLETVKQKMKAYAVAKKKDLVDVTTKSLMAIERDAKRNVVVDEGMLRSSIHRNQIGLDGEVLTNKEYAPFVEFGTGNLVSVPNDLKEQAEQFRGRGIRQVNLPARPFLYPAFVKERPRYQERIDKALGHEEI